MAEKPKKSFDEIARRVFEITGQYPKGYTPPPVTAADSVKTGLKGRATVKSDAVQNLYESGAITAGSRDSTLGGLKGATEAESIFGKTPGILNPKVLATPEGRTYFEDLTRPPKERRKTLKEQTFEGLTSTQQDSARRFQHGLIGRPKAQTSKKPMTVQQRFQAIKTARQANRDKYGKILNPDREAELELLFNTLIRELQGPGLYDEEDLGQPSGGNTRPKVEY